LGDNWSTATKINGDTIVGNTFTYTISQNGSYTFLVKAIDNSGNYSENAISKEITVNIVSDAVTNLTAAQETQDISKIKISWTASPGKDIAGYEIKYGNDWDTGTEITLGTSEIYYEWKLSASGTYNIMVKAKTVATYYSNVANVSITAFIEAYDVTGFAATQSISDRTKVTLTWDPPIGNDVSYFIIKKGLTWDTGTVIAPRVYGTSYDTIVTEETDQTFWIKAVTTAGNESQNAAKIEGIYSLNPSPVSNIVMAQSTTDKSILTISWTGISESDLTGYQAKIGQTWDTATALPLTQELSTTYNLTTTGDVKVMIKTVTAAGFYSDEVSAHLYCTVEPLDVTGLVAYQNGETIELYWDKASEVDVTAYEVREGANFSQGRLVATGLTQPEVSGIVDTERAYQYFVKAINKSGHYSLRAASKSITVANLPVRNVIETFDEITLQNGTHSNTEFGASLINFQTLGGKFPDYPTTKFSDVGGTVVLKLKKFVTGFYSSPFMPGDSYALSGVYSCVQIDMGSIITANFTAYFVSTVTLRGSGSAVLQLKTSQDGTTWTAWQDFKPVQYTFRYAQFKVLLGTTSAKETPEVNHLLIKIDVPDTDIAKTTTIAVGGTTVAYGHTYYTVPIITPTAVGSGLHAELVSKTVSNCVIVIKNESNTDVGGQADVRIKGY
jgi:hypothetical protein